MITVIDGGPLTTMQDLGRAGHAHLGVPRAGALDSTALAFGNALVGNATGAAGLECTLRGPVLRFDAPAVFAITGATANTRIDGEPVAIGVAHTAAAGTELHVGMATSGLRTYVSFAGGIDAPVTLGSRSTDTLTGLGPAPLAAGAVLSLIATEHAPRPAVEAAPASEGPIRVVLGPRDDWFTADALTALTSEPFSVSPTSNRVGLRLTGPALAYARSDELRSEGLALGAIQVPPNGQPIVMLADHPTTGGYPVVGVVAEADLPRLAQLRPGAQLRFRVGAD